MPVIDLLRVGFPTSGITVDVHVSDELSIVTDAWSLSLRAVDETAAESFLVAMRQIARQGPDSLRDIVTAPGAPTIHRLRRGIDASGLAQQVQSVVSFDEGWAYGGVFLRDSFGHLDMTPADRLILAMKLADEPRPDAEVLLAWRAYQGQGLRPGSPLAKFGLPLKPNPIILGDESVDSFEWSVFTEENYENGGRQIAPRLFEFYTKGDPISIRLDLWLEEPPLVPDREVIFGATLDLQGGRIKVNSFDSTVDAHLPPGK